MTATFQRSTVIMISDSFANNTQFSLVREAGRANSAHGLYGIYHEGMLITSFGVRRGSKKEMSNPHTRVASVYRAASWQPGSIDVLR